MGNKLFLKRNFDMFLEYILKFLKLDRASDFAKYIINKEITTGTRLPIKPKIIEIDEIEIEDVDDDNNNNNNNNNSDEDEDEEEILIELVPESDSESESEDA